MDIHIRGNRSAATLPNEVASLFVFENLGLAPGDQSSLLAVKDLNCEDNVKLVARVVRHNRGCSFLQRYKFALDSVTGTVFVSGPDAEDANLMSGLSFQVDDKVVSFYRVLKIEKRPADLDLYQATYCLRIWPLRI